MVEPVALPATGTCQCLSSCDVTSSDAGHEAHPRAREP